MKRKVNRVPLSGDRIFFVLQRLVRFRDELIDVRMHLVVELHRLRLLQPAARILTKEVIEKK